MKQLAKEFKNLKFKFPDLTNKRVLVLGIGGGCDVITAHSVAKIYGNTVGPRKDLDSLPQKGSYIYAMHPGEPVPIAQGDDCFGSVRIEASLPRDELGSPLLFVIPHTIGSVEDVTKENKRALVNDIERMNFDFIFGVDAGGDSLTASIFRWGLFAGGIDWVHHPALGRDRQMLSVLTSIPNSQFFHLMVSPCSDGESSYETMTNCFDEMIKRNHYKGWIECDSMVPTLKELSSVLSPRRTPNILVRAFQNELEVVSPSPKHRRSNSQAHIRRNSTGHSPRVHSEPQQQPAAHVRLETDESDVEPFVRVPRGLEPVVPLEWLLRCYVFEWPRDLNPLYCLPDGDVRQTLKSHQEYDEAKANSQNHQHQSNQNQNKQTKEGVIDAV